MYFIRISFSYLIFVCNCFFHISLIVAFSYLIFDFCILYNQFYKKLSLTGYRSASHRIDRLKLVNGHVWRPLLIVADHDHSNVWEYLF